MATYAKPEKKHEKKAANLTGIPDKMKSKYEGFSGISFSDVRVHYNSDKPAQLQAYAYTQGNQVYVAPRQEQHLEHELGHVVQQKLGLVKPTKKLRGVEVNDNDALERDADVMSKKNLSMDSEKVSNLQDSFPAANIVQGKLYGSPHDAKSLIQSQIDLQKKTEDEIAEKIKECNPNDEGAYTTVGFEHEFASIEETDKLNRLKNLTHVELAESREKLAFTDLPFKLETDSNDTVELVGAPFIIATAKENPIPNSDDVKTADDFMNNALQSISDGNYTFDDMKENFKTNMGLTFEFKKDILIDAHNFNPGAYVKSDDCNISENDIQDLKIKYGAKSQVKTSSQINFATSAFIYDIANDVLPRKSTSASKEYIEKQSYYWGAINKIKGAEISPNATIFLKELAKNLSQVNAVKYQKELNEKKELLFTPFKETKEYKDTDPMLCKNLSKEEIKTRREAYNKLKDKYDKAQEIFNDLRSKSGWVKDANTFWLKDTLYNFGIGILNKYEWQRVRDICNTMRENEDFKECKEAVELLIRKIDELLDKQSPIAEKPKVSFGEHKPEFLGARQDTFISLAGKKRAPHFRDKSFHLVEMRSTDNLKEDLDKIKEISIEKQQSIKDSPELKEPEKNLDLLFENKSKQYSYKIAYEFQKKEISITYSGNLRRKTTTIPVSDLGNSKIKLDEDKEIYTITIEAPSLTYIMTLTKDEALIFREFIDKVLMPYNFKRGI